MERLSFIKMHGLGNDFVVLDGREVMPSLNRGRIQAIANRRTGIGCDQLVVMEPSTQATADVFMRIYNADGSEAGACGNATRCVAWLVMRERNVESLVVETIAGLLDAEAVADGSITVDMGRARLDWRDIPLSRAMDTLHLDISAGPLQDPVGIGMGNPHAVFFVDDADAVDLAAFGPGIETHALFPEFTNVEVASLLPDGRIRMRVWERGAGITPACGSGACATLVAAARRGLGGRKAEIVLDGGSLVIEWLADDHVLMTGPVAVSFSGIIDAGLAP